MNDLITHSNKDITKELFDRAQFISWAEGGAMGDAGAVIIITDDGKSYYCNWAYGDADTKLISEACPLLKKFPDLPPEWEHHYLGMGNHLIYRKEYDGEYCALLAQSAKQQAAYKPDMPPYVFEYQLWLEIAVKLCAGSEK